MAIRPAFARQVDGGRLLESTAMCRAQVASVPLRHPTSQLTLLARHLDVEQVTRTICTQARPRRAHLQRRNGRRAGQLPKLGEAVAVEQPGHLLLGEQLEEQVQAQLAKAATVVLLAIAHTAAEVLVTVGALPLQQWALVQQRFEAVVQIQVQLVVDAQPAKIVLGEPMAGEQLDEVGAEPAAQQLELLRSARQLGSRHGRRGEPLFGEPFPNPRSTV